MELCDKIWWTRKSRIQTEKRLLGNAFQSQVLLLWYSFFGVAVSIFYLKVDPNTIPNNLAGISWVVYSVLVLVISGFINGLGFKERAALVKESYEALNRLYHQAKDSGNNSDTLSKDYEQVLSLCENHTDDDYHSALCVLYLSETNKANLDRKPNGYHWFRFYYSSIKKITILLFLYALPILICVVLHRLP